ncbi:MAG: hypothetical protein ACRD6W_01410, partial [Nitrososphaerales archaeon]
TSGVFNAPLPIGGNYWSGYTPTSVTNGIGSPPYAVPSGAGLSGYYDLYPLGSPRLLAPMTFASIGLPAGTVWTVTLNASDESQAVGGPIGFLEQNGEYSFRIGTVLGYTADPSVGILTVMGGSITATITFHKTLRSEYLVSFAQTGVASGSLWTVTVTQTGIGSGSSMGAAGPSWSFSDLGGAAVTLQFENGTYAYVLSAPSYQTVNGTFAVDGASIGVHASTQPVSAMGPPPAHPGTFPPGASAFVLILVVVAAAACLAAMSLLWLRGRRGRSPPTSSSPAQRGD